jgi:hypothetical protein
VVGDLHRRQFTRSDLVCELKQRQVVDLRHNTKR